MAHYDLYKALNLDRSKAPDEIASELTSRLENNQLDNLGGKEEVEIARNILGDPQKRTIYDSRLDDPNAAEVDVNALRQLSAMDLSGAGGQAGGTDAAVGAVAGGGVDPNAGGQGNHAAQSEKKGPSFGDRMKEAGAKTQQQVGPAMAKTKSEFSRSSGLAIALTAIITAVVMLLIWGAFSLFGGGSDDTVTGKGVPNKKIEKFLKLRDEGETDKWIRDNVHIKLQDQLIDDLDLDGDYRGMDRYFGVEEPTALYTLDLDDEARISSNFEEDRVKDAYKNSELKRAYAVQIGDKNGRDSGQRLAVMELEDGKLAIGSFEASDDDQAKNIEDFDVSDLVSSSVQQLFLL